MIPTAVAHHSAVCISCLTSSHHLHGHLFERRASTFHLEICEGQPQLGCGLVTVHTLAENSQVGWLTVSLRFCWFWCQRIKESVLPVSQRDGLWLKLKMSESNMSFIIIKLLMRCSNEMLPLTELWYSQPGVFQYKIFPLLISLAWLCRSWTWISLVEDLLAPGSIFEQFSIRIFASKQTILISILVSGNGHSAKRSWCDFFFFLCVCVEFQAG